jgi:hypothetical protein
MLFLGYIICSQFVNSIRKIKTVNVTNTKGANSCESEIWQMNFFKV